MKSKKLKAELARKIAEAKDLRDAVKDREMTVEESAKVTALLAEVENTKAAIAAAETEEAALASLGEAITDAEQPRARVPLEIGDGAEEARQDAARARAQNLRVSVRPRFFGKLVCFPNTEQGLRDAYYAGQGLRARLLKPGTAKHAEALRFCRDHRDDMWPDAANMSGTIAADGGVLVPDALEASVLEVQERYGAVRRIIAGDGLLYPMSSDTQTVPIENALPTVYSTAQGAAITTSKPTFTFATLSAKKLGVLIPIPRELIEDAVINVADYAARKAGEALAKAEDNDAMNGDGTGTYHGIVGLLPLLVDGNHAGSLTACSGATADTFAEVLQADLDNIGGDLPENWGPRARWFASKKCAYRVLARLARAAGGATVDEMTGRKVRSYDGDEIVFVQTMPANPLYYTGSTDYSGLPMLLYGDIGSALVMGQRRGLAVDVSNEIYFAEDMVAVRVTERVDMQPGAVGDGTLSGAIRALIGS